MDRMDRMSQEGANEVLTEHGGAACGLDPCNQPGGLHRESHVAFTPDSTARDSPVRARAQTGSQWTC